MEINPEKQERTRGPYRWSGMRVIGKALGLFVLTIGATVALASPVAADPGDGATVDEVSTPVWGQKTTTQTTTAAVPLRRKTTGGPTINGTQETIIAGGVNAYSMSGLQWRYGVFFHDVRGIMQSQTTVPIDEIETHGVLIRSTNDDCYGGEYQWSPPTLIENNSSFVGTGWGPWVSGNNNGAYCWVMASGHYYINMGSRTDVQPVDTIEHL